MIAGIFHQGSGLGNQIFRYITVRSLAERKGYNWGMMYAPDGSGKETGFKGKFFLEQPRMATDYEMTSLAYGFNEKKVMENGVDIRGYDPEINFVGDWTVVDGEFQDQKYWPDLYEVNNWLQVEPLYVPDDVCVIGFRGGEYAVYADLFLTNAYWDEAIAKSGFTKFEVHTDDPILANKFFPDYPIVADISLNWRAMRYAKAAIIANSSFYIIPRLLKHVDEEWDDFVRTIAPRYWARHNTKVWALPQNYYPQFTYV